MKKRYGISIKVKGPTYRYKLTSSVDADSFGEAIDSVKQHLGEIYEALDTEAGNEFKISINVFRYNA